MLEKTLRKWLERHEVTLVLCEDGWPSVEEAAHLLGFLSSADLRVSNVHGEGSASVGWSQRTVVMTESLYGTAYVPHALAHAIYEEPPDDMPPEAHTWMPAAEENIAKRLGIYGTWLSFFGDVPLDDLDSAAQHFASDLSWSGLRKFKDFWMTSLRERGLMRGSWLQNQRWVGQARSHLGVGLFYFDGNEFRS